MNVKGRDLRGRKVSVIGAAKSGIAAAGLLRKIGAVPFISEQGEIGSDESAMLATLGIAFEPGGHTERVFDADFCIISPGVPQHAPVIMEMRARGIAVYSEIELASWFCQARIIGVTGTDGKTTTTTLIHTILEADGLRKGYHAFCVGNIGVPFSSEVLNMGPDDTVVIELSSYQLEGCESFRPQIAIITNITPDHLARYGGDMQRYAEAKFRIYARQGGQDSLIYNDDDPLLHRHFSVDRGFPFTPLPFSTHQGQPGLRNRNGVYLDGEMIVSLEEDLVRPVIETGEFMKRSFRGEHNLSNALAAVAACRAAGVDVEVIRKSLVGFQGVEHRQEFAGNVCGLDWINDSKATNVNAMKQALQANPGEIVLIAGGRDKGNDYRLVSDLVREKVVCIIAVGESKEKLRDAFDGITTVKMADSMQQAVTLARSSATSGQTVLFSPACASFDMFANFEERGKTFKKLVRELSPC
jgi:UDP-N-acetylmuramoylalanine--D-glutamate ligase